MAQRGCLPVGEIGKNLQFILGSDAISRKLKELYGGLKKTLENALESSVKVGQDHPFNPTLYLSSVDGLDLASPFVRLASSSSPGGPGLITINRLHHAGRIVANILSTSTMKELSLSVVPNSNNSLSQSQGQTQGLSSGWHHRRGQGGFSPKGKRSSSSFSSKVEYSSVEASPQTQAQAHVGLYANMPPPMMHYAPSEAVQYHHHYPAAGYYHSGPEDPRERFVGLPPPQAGYYVSVPVSGPSISPSGGPAVPSPLMVFSSTQLAQSPLQAALTVYPLPPGPSPRDSQNQ